MASRSLNKVMLIGNLTRDPELRYTPSGVPVCSFGLATNRSWTTQSGDQKEDAQFHQIVAWNRLAELCSQLLKKGRKIYVEGRLQYREWTDSSGNKRQRAEITISDMMLLDSRRGAGEGDEQLDAELDKAAEFTAPEEEVPSPEAEAAPAEEATTQESQTVPEQTASAGEEAAEAQPEESPAEPVGEEQAQAPEEEQADQSEEAAATDSEKTGEEGKKEDMPF